jgi:hypothetical protein
VGGCPRGSPGKPFRQAGARGVVPMDQSRAQEHPLRPVTVGGRRRQDRGVALLVARLDVPRLGIFVELCQEFSQPRAPGGWRRRPKERNVLWLNRHPVLLLDERGQHLFIHLAILVLVNALLLVINLTSSPERLWVKWPLLGWGIGILFHGLAVFFFCGDSSIRKGTIVREMKK